MGGLLRILCAAWCLQIAAFTESPCVIELQCAECMPDNMPLVTSHRAINGTVAVAEGDEVALSCAAGNFLLYPLRGSLVATCDEGFYRLRHDRSRRHLLELGCQEDIFEDVLHEVEHCSPPLQGRAYQTQAADGARHLATVCFDADRALAVRAHVAAPLRLPPHSDGRSPLSLLGNFNHMFDARTRAAAERLYSDDARLDRRLRELLRHDRIALAGQTLTAGRLLGGGYFDGQDARVSDFASNEVAVWGSVAEGNLRHLHRDVGRLLRSVREAARTPTPPELHVYAGTHGVLSLRTDGSARREVFLRAGRFPVPRYLWTVVHAPGSARALAVVLLNDPLVAVSEIRAAVFCESACAGVSWLRELRRQRRYETPLYGLVFCCSVHNFTALVPEMPAEIVRNVPPGAAGMLLDLEDPARGQTK